MEPASRPSRVRTKAVAMRAMLRIVKWRNPTQRAAEVARKASAIG